MRSPHFPWRWLFASGALVSVTFAAPSSPSSAAAPRPNIIFLLCDDLGYGDVGVFFQNQLAAQKDRSRPWHSTPNLDRFAAEGAQLPHHYCPAPVCAPSRASLLLGVTQGHANVRDSQFDKALEDNHTLASVLKEAGYATAAIGKWGLQGKESVGPDWTAGPQQRGFDSYFGYIAHNDGHEHYPKEGVYKGKKPVWDNREEVSDQCDKCYTADLFTARAKHFIAGQVQAHREQPFFLYLALDTPHATIELPTQAYPAGGGLKGGLQWLGEPGHMINTASGQPDSYQHPDYAGATWDDDHNAATPEVPWPDVYKRYATSVRRIDDCLGDLIQELKDLGIDENTLIVFSTDNGPSKESYLKEGYAPNFFHAFGPFDGIKRDCWEGGVRVGALARWPAGIKGGQVVNTPSGFWDWLPTFVDLAGLPAPARSDGRSLVPALTGRGTQRAPTVYIEFSNNEKTPGYADFTEAHRNRKRAQMQMVRLGDFVGVRYDIKSHADEFEIYNVVQDPQEAKNLAASHPALQQQMKDAVLGMRRPSSEALRPYDQELVPAVNAPASVTGLQWKSALGRFPWVPDLAPLSGTAGGLCAQPHAAELTAAGAVLYNGYLKVPSNGAYTIYLTTAGGAFLRLHDAQLIDADRPYHAGSEIEARVPLKAGLHPFQLTVWQKAETPAGLSLQWSGPGFTKQPIPESAFVHAQGTMAAPAE